MFLTILVCCLITSCAVPISEKRWDKPTDILFGTIINVERVPMSEIDDATMVGGFRGIAEGDLTDRAEQNVVRRLKDNDTYLYTIRRNSGSLVTYATEKQFMVEGDCIAIEQGVSNNLRLVGDSNCQPGKKRTAGATKKQEIVASQCLLAKRQLVLAQNEQQLATANRQIEDLCVYQR